MQDLSESSIREQASKDGITHISTGVAVARDGKILIVRRAAADYLGGQYELPGGGVDAGETIIDAAIREVKEETGLTVSKVLTVFDGFDYTTDRKPHVRQVNFLVEVEDGEIVLNPDEHDEFQWADSNTDLDGLMSANMKICVAEALQLASQMHLYLLTLEVDPLIVGNVYNPLPSHLTLVSRFWSELPHDEIAEAVKPIFAQAAPIELIYGGQAVIGPKKTAVHLVENTAELVRLHSQLVEKLDTLNVAYVSPQFVGTGHRPHVSKRENIQFAVGDRHLAHNAYLIEVEIRGKDHLRNICTRFTLGS